MMRKGVSFRRADNTRVARDGHIGGWDQMRARLKGDDQSRAMIGCFSTCRASVSTIPVLQHDKDRPEDLDTHSIDHCFAAGTLVDTSIGAVPIERVRRGVHGVWSNGKWRYNIRPRRTRDCSQVLRLTFSDGLVIKCTPDHLFMDFSGEWRYAKDLEGMEVLCDQSLSAKRSKNLTVVDTTSAGAIFKEMGFGSIELCGKALSATFQKVRTFITKIMMRTTTHPTTWSAWKPSRICEIGMAKKVVSADSGPYTKHASPPLSGTLPKRAGNGIAITSSEIYARSWSSVNLQPVTSAAAATWSPSLNESRANIAATRARPVLCVAVEEAGSEAVYCLTEPETNAFTIHGGIVVHNCADDWRYACMSRPWVRKKPDDKKADPFRPPTLGELTQMHDARMNRDRWI